MTSIVTPGSIKGLGLYYSLMSEWNDVVNCAYQADSWAKQMLSKISILQNDVNFLSNASPAEISYLNNWTTVLNNFISSEPVNPDL